MKNRQDGELAANYDERKIRTIIEKIENTQDFTGIPNFGIWNPNIKEMAASLARNDPLCYRNVCNYLKKTIMLCS